MSSVASNQRSDRDIDIETVLSEEQVISSDNQKPVLSGDDEPISSGDEKPVSSGDEKPVSSGDEEPDRKPLVNRTALSEEQIMSNDEKPVLSGDDEPISSSDEKPVSSGDEKPISSGDEKPVLSGDDKPISLDAEKTVSSGDEKSILSDDEKPVSSGDGEPVSSCDEEPEKEPLVNSPTTLDTSPTDDETGRPDSSTNVKKMLIKVAVAVVIAGTVALVVVLIRSTGERSSQDHTYHDLYQQTEDCNDPTKVIQPENIKCEGGKSCLKCQETIPSAGYRDLSDGKTCEGYTISDDGKVLYVESKGFSEEDILNGIVHRFGKEEKKYTQRCCILNRMRSRSEPCPKDYEYKCTEYDSDPECRCKKDRVCAGNSTITVLCKCFWSSCKFADETTLEDCRNTTKKPEFKLCLLRFSNFKCQCKSETADEKLPPCSASETKVPYQPSHQKGSNEISWKSVWFLTLFICFLTLLFMAYFNMV